MAHTQDYSTSTFVCSEPGCSHELTVDDDMRQHTTAASERMPVRYQTNEVLERCGWRRTDFEIYCPTHTHLADA